MPENTMWFSVMIRLQRLCYFHENKHTISNIILILLIIIIIIDSKIETI